MSNFKVRRLRKITYAIYTHAGRTLKISTGIQVEDQDWQKDHVRRSDPHHKSKNEIIEAKLQLLQQAHLRLTLDNLEPTENNMRKQLKQTSHQEHYLDLYEESFIDVFVKYHASKKGTRATTTLSNINQTMEVLKAFESSMGLKLCIKSFDRSVFTELIRFYLEDCGYNDRTIDKHLKVVRGFIKWAYPDFNRSFISFKIKKDDTVIHFTEEELLCLINADLIDKLDRVRDLFIFSCLTGMRYSDLAKFNKSWIQDGVIIFTQAKTSGLAVSPIFTNAYKILQKYDYNLPRLSNTKFNLYLKDLFEYLQLDRSITITRYQGNKRMEQVKPLFKLVTTHVARKTFISLALDNGIPIQDVMKMSGHSDYRGIRPYISVSKEHLIKVSKKWNI